MTEPRFFVSPDAIHGSRVTFSPEQSRQIARVLRLLPGAAVLVLDNTGYLHTVRLERVHPRQTVGFIVDTQEAGNEPPITVVLYQALLKGERMDFVLQKGTEIGVTQFVPILTERTVVRRTEKRGRWERIVIEAAEQCRRGRLPEIGDILTFEEALAHARNTAVRLIAHNAVDVLPWKEIRRQYPEQPPSVALFIGPEGGFTEAEVTQARAWGVSPVHLGPRTLRAETAALVALTLVLYHWGDIGVI